MDLMRTEDKIAWLSQYRIAQHERRYLKKLIAKIEAQSSAISSRLDGMPRGNRGIHDAMAESVVDLEATRQKLQELEAEIVRAMRQIVEWISTIPDTYTRAIFMRRYISNWTWLRIGVDLERDETTVRWHHNKYLESCDSIPESIRG